MTADEKICPDCAEKVKAAAKICRFCGHKFAEPGIFSRAAEEGAKAAAKKANELRQKEIAKNATSQHGEKPERNFLSGKGILIALGIFVGLAVIVQISEPSDGTKDSDPSEHALKQATEPTSVSTDPVDDIATAPAEVHSNWIYNETEDQMRAENEHTASIRSENTVNFGFPYGGAQRMTMQLRDSPAHGNDVIFVIEKGQITCDVYDCIGAISFDGDTEQLTLGRSADGDTTVGFARYPEAIARKIKSADEVVVELTFYLEGVRQFSFNTANLEWDHF